ncbi:MAG: metal-dependent hydrolase [Gammaproteobacteria bacterium]|nr:metal-dependent hydrolase [Gammaproteobacteria bacterium]
MDTLSHACLGALLARAGQPTLSRRESRLWLACGAFAAAFPDIDYAAFWLDPYRFHTEWHRGPTHSLLMLPLWAWLIGLGFQKAAKAPSQRPWFFLAALGLASHAGTDLLTVYGIQLLYPASEARYSLGISFVLDPVFSLIVAGGLALSLWRRRSSWLALALLGAYWLFQAGLRAQALELASQEWSRLHWPGARIAAFPQPLSPYHWLLTVGDESRWRQTRVRLDAAPTWLAKLPGLGELAAGFLPVQALRWREERRFSGSERAEVLWNSPRLAAFRRFAYEPHLYRIDDEDDVSCYWYSDAAFELPGQTPPFRYGLCRAAATGDWRLSRLRMWTENDRENMPE